MGTDGYTGKEYWDQYWKKEKRGKGEKEDFYFSDLMNHYICWDSVKSYLEVGGAPGTIMAFMNQQHGLRVASIDFTEKDRIEELLKARNVKDYQIYQEDFRTFDSKSHRKKYDMVASWGFIEHFKRRDTAKFIEKQKQMVSDNGYLIVELPNIRRVIWLIYYIFNRDLIRIHNLKIMDLPWLRKQVLRGDEFKIIYSSYYFTMNPQNEYFVNHRFLKKLCKRAVEFFNKCHCSEKIKRYFFPYIVIIARRRGAAEGMKQEALKR